MQKFIFALFFLGTSLTSTAQDLVVADCERVIALPTTTAFLTAFTDLPPGERIIQTQDRISQTILDGLQDFSEVPEELYVELTIDKKGQVFHFFCDEERFSDYLRLVLEMDLVFSPATYQDEAVCSKIGLSISTHDLYGQDGPTAGEIFRVVEQMPLFYSEGCSQYASYQDRKYCAEGKMLEAIYRHIHYPEEARRNQIEGMAIVSFVIGTDGRAYDHQVVRDPGGGCGEEALRLVRNYLTDWLPGIDASGSAVNVQFNLPIKFKL